MFQGDRLLTELDHDLANMILVQSTSAMQHMGDDDDEEGEPMDRSRSPSPPRVFCGDIVKSVSPTFHFVALSEI